MEGTWITKGGGGERGEDWRLIELYNVITQKKENRFKIESNLTPFAATNIEILCNVMCNLHKGERFST